MHHSNSGLDFRRSTVGLLMRSLLIGITLGVIPGFFWEKSLPSPHAPPFFFLVLGMLIAVPLGFPIALALAFKAGCRLRVLMIAGLFELLLLIMGALLVYLLDGDGPAFGEHAWLAYWLVMAGNVWLLMQRRRL